MIATAAARPLAALAWTRGVAAARLSALAPVACLVAIGIELALLTAFLPDTADRFLHGPPADFHNLYQPARDRELAGLYSPFLVFLFQPLALLPEMGAYRAFFAINVAVVAAIGVWAQTSVRGFEAKVAVALGPLALPQIHWALRLGHLTPLLAIVALLSFAALHRRELRGALGIALLSIKPQYVIAPLAYFVWKRRLKALGVTIAGAAALAIPGLLLVGPGAFPEYIGRYLDWGSNTNDNLLPVQQAWMVSWTGFQISIGRDPNPLITIDLILLSLTVACFAWSRADARAGVAVIALMLVPLTPYAQFYDGSFVLVAIALLLRAELSPLSKAGCAAGLYLAAVITQSHIHFPVRDVLGDAGSGGVYLLTPALVAVAAFLAIRGQRRPNDEGGAAW